MDKKHFLVNEKAHEEETSFDLILSIIFHFYEIYSEQQKSKLHSPDCMHCAL